jgi:putative peptidoglycan lipid II flippase
LSVPPDPLAPRSAGEREGLSPAARPPTHLAHAAGLIGIATLASRILGVLREQVLAYYFGARDAMDAFNVAFRVPGLVRDLFAEGAMSAAFVPTFTRQLTLRGQAAAWTLGSQVINALLLVTTVFVVFGLLGADTLIGLFAPEFAAVPGKHELAVLLTRIMLPLLTLVALAAAMMGMLNSLRRFFVPALSPALFNIGTILSAVAFVPVMPALGLHPITAVAFGTLLGGFGQVAVQWPALHRAGYRYRPVLDPRDEGLRDVLILMGPGTMGLAATQVNVFVNTVLATGEGTGAVSWLNYAFRLMYLPIGLFGVSIATAAVPAIARHAAQHDVAGIRATISSGLRMMLMLNVPATVGLIVLASPIIRLLFERGQFTAADTAATAAALTFYAPGLLGYSAVKIAVPTFYALRDSRTPVAVSFMTVACAIVLNIVFVRAIGYRGLALGTALAGLLNAILLLALLGRRLGGLDGQRIFGAFIRIGLASAVMGVAVFRADYWLQVWLPGPALGLQIVRVFGAIAGGVVVLALAARLLRIREFELAVQQVTARLLRPRPAEGGQP